MPPKCLECHEDKSKGKAVHSAIATGCLSCHEVRVNRDVTRVKLTTTTTQALCLSCHDDKKVQAGQTMHPPAVRDCVKCHDPHQSDNPNQLLKATSGRNAETRISASPATRSAWTCPKAAAVTPLSTWAAIPAT